MGSPLNGRVEVGGPEQFRMDEFFRDVLARLERPALGGRRPARALLRTELGERTLVPDGGAALGQIRYRDWPGRTATGK
ncbi:hypothetical protein ACFQX6_07865 [Streptosporangium lutulentum]